MGYNVLSGSVSNLYDIKASGSFTGSFGGDGTNLENVTQFDLYGQTTAGAIPYYKSVSGETHLEGDSTFTFNSNTDTLSISRLSASSGINLSGILAGTATTSSFLALDSNGNIVLTSSAAGGSGGSDDDFSASGNGIGSSGVFFARTVVNSTQVISKTSYYIGVSASSNITLTLPLANMTSVGQTFVFKDEIGSAGTYDIFIATAMNNTIDGITSVKLESPFGAVNIYSNGADKYFMY
jgi:hypothetical protein